MTADAAAALRRLLQTIPRLSDGKVHAIDQVARLSRTDRTTVLRDLFSLAERVGEPGGFIPGLKIFIDGKRGVRVDPSRHFRRPMGLSLQELYALDLGLAILRQERPPTAQAAVDRARTRLRRLAARLPAGTPPNPRAADVGAAGDDAALTTIRQALRDRRRVRLTYRSADAQQSTSRVVSPYGLVAARGAWYLIAHCKGRDAIRIFRLDRVEETRLLTTKYSVPASFSLDSVVKDGRVFRTQEAQSLVVRYSPRVARWIAEREHRTLSADGSVTVEYPLADTQWAVRHVLQYGPDAQVMAPDRVRQAVRQRLEGIVSPEE